MPARVALRALGPSSFNVAFSPPNKDGYGHSLHQYDSSNLGRLHVECRRNKKNHLRRIRLWEEGRSWRGGSQINWMREFSWGESKHFLPIPFFSQRLEDITQIFNKRWKVQDSTQVWRRRFDLIWDRDIPDKMSTLQRLILHQAVWTQCKGLRIGKSNGSCAKCTGVKEDIFHLFISCWPACGRKSSWWRGKR